MFRCNPAQQNPDLLRSIVHFISEYIQPFYRSQAKSQINSHPGVSPFFGHSPFVRVLLAGRLGANGLGTPPERNWRGVLQPSYLLRKAHDDVDKFSEAQGALKQAMCSMSVSREQVRRRWRRDGDRGERWGVPVFMHGRSRMTIDPRIPTMPGWSTSGFHRPGRRQT